jgi:imidazolonepropionase-like amidohydrolase
VTIPKDAEIIDLSKAWVMPGVMDSHTHITEGGAEHFQDLDMFYLRESTGFRALRGLHTGQILLRAGITTVRDIGNEGSYAAVDLRRALEKDWFVGPTVLAAGKIIAPFGGQSHRIPPEQGAYWQYEYYDADGPEAVRAAVRKNIFYGVNVIKLVADNSQYHYSVAELQAAVDESHQAGFKVAVHVLGGKAADNVIEAGPDSIEHGFYLTDEQLRKMKEKGIFLAGTEFPGAHFEHGGYPNGKAISEKVIDRLRRAYNVGVKMGFSTDIVTEMPGETRADMTWDYLSMWKAAGVPAAEILKCMTTNNAELLGISAQRGAITPGLFADIIAMPESPLANIEALRAVNFVMKNGTVIVWPK